MYHEKPSTDGEVSAYQAIDAIDLVNLPLFPLQALISGAIAEWLSRVGAEADTDRSSFRVAAPHPLCDPGDRSVKIVIQLLHERE